MPIGGYPLNESQLDVEAYSDYSTFNGRIVGDLLTTGWRGGTFVMHAGTHPPTLVRSDGTAFAGFILRGSQESERSEYAYTSIQPSNPLGWNNVAVVDHCGFFLFRLFETANAAKRANPAAGANIVYTPNQPLYVSERGLLTGDSVADLQAIGIANPVFAGNVYALPDARTNFRLGLHQY